MFATVRRLLGGGEASGREAARGRVPLRAGVGGGRLSTQDFESGTEAHPPGGLTTFRRMRRDAQVRACLQTKVLSVLSESVEVHPADGTPAARRAAAAVEAQMRALPGGVSGVLEGALDALAMGYSIGEVVWAADGALGEVRWHDPARFTFEGDAWGAVTGLRLTETGQVFPRDRFLVFTHGGRYGSPYGESDLFAAYRPWAQKDVLLRLWLTALERYGAPTVYARLPPTANETDRDAMVTALTKLRSESVMALVGDIEVRTLESGSGDVGAAFRSALDWHNREIAKSILGQTLTTEPGGDGSGSYALGRVHSGILDQWCDALRRQLADGLLTDQLARRLSVMAAGPDAPGPRIVLPKLTAEEMAARRALVTDMITGQVVAPAEGWIREYLGLPGAVLARG